MANAGSYINVNQSSVQPVTLESEGNAENEFTSEKEIKSLSDQLSANTNPKIQTDLKHCKMVDEDFIPLQGTSNIRPLQRVEEEDNFKQVNRKQVPETMPERLHDVFNIKAKDASHTLKSMKMRTQGPLPVMEPGEESLDSKNIAGYILINTQIPNLTYTKQEDQASSSTFPMCNSSTIQDLRETNMAPKSESKPFTETIPETVNQTDLPIYVHQQARQSSLKRPKTHDTTENVVSLKHNKQSKRPRSDPPERSNREPAVDLDAMKGRRKTPTEKVECSAKEPTELCMTRQLIPVPVKEQERIMFGHENRPGIAEDGSKVSRQTKQLLREKIMGNKRKPVTEATDRTQRAELEYHNTAIPETVCQLEQQSTDSKQKPCKVVLQTEMG